MAKKSSLKTFLNTTAPIKGVRVSGAKMLRQVTNGDGSNFWDGSDLWAIDVLDDGTAITYCFNE
jgi:hypothetical protein